MRSRAISSLAFSIICVGSVTLGGMLASGCGSGHQTNIPTPATPTPSPTPTPAPETTVKATILWPQRSRQTVTTTGGSAVQIAALASAQSAAITFTGANAAGGDIVIYGNRPTGPTATATTYASTAVAKPGTYPLSVKFYNKPLTAAGAVDPTAVVVATAQANTQVLNNGTLSATITTIGQIQSVVVTAGQILALGSTSVLQFTAYGAPVNGQQVIIPVVSGAEQVSVTNVDASRPPVATVTNGIVTAAYPGQAQVTVSIDGVSSDPTAASAVISVISTQTVSISPNPATVPVGTQITFAATTTNPAGSSVTWSLGTDAATAASGASINAATGVFSAPNRSGGPYTVIATSQYDTTKVATAAVTITSNVGIYPTGQATTSRTATVEVGANKSVLLPVSVTGTTNTAVTYAVVGNTADSTANGTVGTDGTYTAPNSEGTYTVTATSQADTAQVVTFTIHVNPSVTIAPRRTTVSVDQAVQFFANVVGGASNQVIYTIAEAGGGTINASTGAYTAPATAGTYHITATSVANPSESDTATVVVQSGTGTVIVQ